MASLTGSIPYDVRKIFSRLKELLNGSEPHPVGLLEAVYSMQEIIAQSEADITDQKAKDFFRLLASCPKLMMAYKLICIEETIELSRIALKRLEQNQSDCRSKDDRIGMLRKNCSDQETELEILRLEWDNGRYH